METIIIVTIIITLIIAIPGIYFNSQTKKMENQLTEIESQNINDKTIIYMMYKEITKIRKQINVILIIMLIPIIITIYQINILIKIIKTIPIF